MKNAMLALVSFILYINVQAQSPDEIAIKSKVSNFEIVFNQKDPKGTANFWSEDGDYITHLGDLLHGRQELEKYFQNVFVQYYKSAQNKLMTPTIRFIKPDVAAVDVKWEMTNATSPDGKQMPTFKGIMVWTMTKENGNWYIKVMHNVSLP